MEVLNISFALKLIRQTDHFCFFFTPFFNISDWQMGRDATIWGPDCGEFKPDRWIDESGRVKQFGQFKFHAFNVRLFFLLGVISPQRLTQLNL
jgi:fatty acid omega-hydroxylase